MKNESPQDDAYVKLEKDEKDLVRGHNLCRHRLCRRVNCTLHIN